MMPASEQVPLPLSKHPHSPYQAFSLFVSKVFPIISKNLALEISASGESPNMNQNFSESKSCA